jgi:hypothetical protein
MGSMVKTVEWDFSLIINRAPHGSGFLCPPSYTFYSRSCAAIREVLADKLFEWDDFSLGKFIVYSEKRELTRGSSILKKQKRENKKKSGTNSTEGK